MFIPQSITTLVELHVGHPGIVRTKVPVSDGMHTSWPGLNGRIAKFLFPCAACHTVQSVRIPPTAPVYSSG